MTSSKPPPRVTDTIESIRKATQLPTTATEALVRSVQKHNASLGMPEVLKHVQEAQRVLGVGRVAAQHLAWTKSFAGWAEITSVKGLAAIANSPAMELHRQLLQSPGLSAIAEAQRAIAETQGAAVEMRHGMASMFPPSVSQALAAAQTALEWMPRITPIPSSFSQHLLASVVPTIMGLSVRPLGHATALFEMLDTTHRAGSLSWFRSDNEESEPHLEIIPWKEISASSVVGAEAEQKAEPNAPAATQINIHADITCVCGGRLIAKERKVSVVSEHEIHLGLAILPFCKTCIDRSRENPNYLREQIEKLTDEPSYWLIDGDAEGDGVPRGQLSIVKKEELQERPVATRLPPPP